MARCWFFLKLVYIIFFFYQYIKTQGFCVFTRKLTSFFYSAIVCSAFSRTRFCWSVGRCCVVACAGAFRSVAVTSETCVLGFIWNIMGGTEGEPLIMLRKEVHRLFHAFGASQRCQRYSTKRISVNEYRSQPRIDPPTACTYKSLFHNVSLSFHRVILAPPRVREQRKSNPILKIDLSSWRRSSSQLPVWCFLRILVCRFCFAFWVDW
jgi:hypothetical protein